MINPVQNAHERASMIKDISDREQIIRGYRSTGKLDRNEAIRKIFELRQTDVDVATATVARLAVSSTPFEQTTNDGLAAELQMQVNVLLSKLAEKTNEV